MVAFAEVILPSADDCHKIVSRFDQATVWTVEQLVRDFTEERQARIFRGLKVDGQDGSFGDRGHGPLNRYSRVLPVWDARCADPRRPRREVSVSGSETCSNASCTPKALTLRGLKRYTQLKIEMRHNEG